MYSAARRGTTNIPRLEHEQVATRKDSATTRAQTSTAGPGELGRSYSPRACVCSVNLFPGALSAIPTPLRRYYILHDGPRTRRFAAQQHTTLYCSYMDFFSQCHTLHVTQSHMKVSVYCKGSRLRRAQCRLHEDEKYGLHSGDDRLRNKSVRAHK